MGIDKKDDHSLGHEIGLGVTLVRGLLLVLLGLSLLVIPEKTHKMLFNAMGLFWLTTGIVLIRRDAHSKGNRLLLTVAVLGVLVGVLVLSRDLTRQWLAEAWVKGLLGTAILLTGVLHVTTELRLGREALRGRPLVNLLLGFAEIVLGGLLLFTPTGNEPIVYHVAIVWALLGGGLLVGGTALHWIRERRQEQPVHSEVQPEEQT